jgi:hypothetical protein
VVHWVEWPFQLNSVPVQLLPDQVFMVVAETRLAVPIVRRARRETGWI